MADAYGPFNNAPWSEDQWFRFAALWAPTAVIGTLATGVGAGGLAFTSSGLSVTIGTGRAWVRGAGFERTGTPDPATVTPNSNSTLSRRDRVVLRRDLAARSVAVVVIEGVPAGTPSAPNLEQDDVGQWDLPLFSFLVPPANGTGLSGVIDERRWFDPDVDQRPIFVQTTEPVYVDGAIWFKPAS